MYKTRKSTKNWSSNFGLIEENMDLSCTLLSVTLSLVSLLGIVSWCIGLRNIHKKANPTGLAVWPHIHRLGQSITILRLCSPTWNDKSSIPKVQWIFDLRKFLGTTKNFLKSKIFLKSNTPSSLRYANWKSYIYFYDPIDWKTSLT